MAYLLILPIGLYSALAVLVYSRRPRAPANSMVALFLLNTALSTTGYLILGTTPNRPLAEIASVAFTLVSAFEYLSLPALVIIALFFDGWYQEHKQGLLAVSLSGTCAVIVVYQLLRPDDIPLVYPVTESAWMHWTLARAALDWRIGVGVVFGSQIVTIIVIVIGLARYRIGLYAALGITFASLASALIAVLAPLAGAEALVTITAVKYVPPVLLVSWLFTRTSRQITFEALTRTTLRAYNDGLLILDSRRHVVWRNLQSIRWTAMRDLSTLVQPHIFDVLQGSPLLLPVQQMMSTGQTSGECEFMRDGDEVALRLEFQPLTNVRGLPGATLLILRDITAARMRRNLHERSRELLALSAFSADLASTLDPDQVVARALDQVAALTRADACGVYLLDERDPTRMRLAETRGAPERMARLPPSLPVKQDDSANLVRYVFETRQSIFVNDASQSKDPGNRFSIYGFQAGSLIPLIARDQIIGLFGITYLQPHPFTPVESAMLEGLAQQLAVALDNARLHEIEQRRRVQAEVMRQTTYDLVTSPDVEGALALALVNLARLLAFDRANIGLLDPDGHAWRYRAGLPYMPYASSETIPVSEYPSIHHVVETRLPLLISDTRLDSRWLPGKFSPHEVRCWIGVPLVARERVIGLLNLDSFRPGAFSAEDVQVAQVFANQIAAVIENFRLLTETNRQNQALRALNTVLAASNEALTHDNLPLVLLQRVLDTLGLAEGAIHQYDSAAHEFRLRAAVGLPEALVEHLDHAPIVTPTDERLFMRDSLTDSLVSAPLVSHGIKIGLLSIHPTPEAPISDDMRDLLTHIGQQVGVVMDNATLFEDSMRRAALSTDLGRLSLAIGAQLDRESILRLLCRESLGIFDAQGAYIWLVQDDYLVGAVACGAGEDHFAGHRIPLDAATWLPARILQEWRPRYLNNAAHSPALPADWIEMTHAQSVLAVPLLKADVAIGALVLVNAEREGAFGDWLADQVGLLGVQAALALENAALFDEARRRLDQLRLVNETGRYATAILNPQDLIEGVARKLSVTLHYDLVSLVLVDDKQMAVRSIFAHHRSHPVDTMPLMGQPLRDLASQCAERAEPIMSNLVFALDEQTGPGVILQEMGALAVPLIVADEVSGVLIVARRAPHGITSEDLDVLEPLAAQLTISFQNARLFEKVRRQALELEIRVAERTEEIRQQHERTEAILRSVADAVIVFDLAGRMVMTNPVARQLFEQHDLDMDLSARVGQLVARVLDSSPDVRDVTDIITVGAVTVQAKAARVVEGSEVLGSVVILRDISRLRELDRMKDLFVSNVSHELRTPLANLKLYLSLLEQGRPERRAGYMEVMGREIDRLTRLITDLLHISRLVGEQRDERSPVRASTSLDQLVNMVIQDHLAWAESEHKELWHEALSSPLPAIIGDPDQLVRAIANLVSNALIYTPEGGRIIVRSRVVPGGQTKPEWVIIEVSDTGIGIPAADLPVIFERFYRGSNVKPNTPGTGLGLAIIKEIVRLHGGSVEVESEEGRGSTFRLKFPVPDS
jgi:GAF domain-containing protein